MGNQKKSGLEGLDGHALFRYMLVSLVLTRERWGLVRAEAVKEAAQLIHEGPEGESRRVSARSIYRWLKLYERKGIKGLRRRHRSRACVSVVLSEKQLEFIKENKESDPRASIPELIKRARHEGVDTGMNRSNVWRALKRMGLETRRRRQSKSTHQRRFGYSQPLDMVLCDGKHFRAGPRHKKRVALFFLDDATRMVLRAVVGPSESSSLFLRGLFDCIMRYGLMDRLYVDRGSGFIAKDSLRVAAKLGILLIHGSRRYPEGHGKVERFHQTAWNALMRRFDGNPEVTGDCTDLQLRLKHYVDQVYNREPHEGLQKATPYDRFALAGRSPRVVESEAWLRSQFVLEYKRRVSNDHVINLHGKEFEMPLGTRGEVLHVLGNVLDGSVHMMHQGRRIRLLPVDRQANARRPPVSRRDDDKELQSQQMTHAEKAFQRDYEPLVDDLGNFFE
jgi:putative transposase